MAKAKDKIIREAIANKQTLSFSYVDTNPPGRSGRRIRVQVVAYGLSLSGRPVIRAWVKPPSVSYAGLRKAGSWRMFLVPNMSNLKLENSKWRTSKPGYNTSGDEGMAVIFTMVGNANQRLSAFGKSHQQGRDLSESEYSEMLENAGFSPAERPSAQEVWIKRKSIINKIGPEKFNRLLLGGYQTNKDLGKYQSVINDHLDNDKSIRYTPHDQSLLDIALETKDSKGLITLYRSHDNKSWSKNGMSWTPSRSIAIGTNPGGYITKAQFRPDDLFALGYQPDFAQSELEFFASTKTPRRILSTKRI